MAESFETIKHTSGNFLECRSDLHLNRLFSIR